MLGLGLAQNGLVYIKTFAVILRTSCRYAVEATSTLPYQPYSGRDGYDGVTLSFSAGSRHAQPFNLPDVTFAGQTPYYHYKPSAASLVPRSTPLQFVAVLLGPRELVYDLRVNDGQAAERGLSD